MARILQVCNTDFYLSRFLRPLVRELVAHGHEVDCVCEGQDIDQDSFGPDVCFHEIAFPRNGSIVQFVSCIRRMRRLIRAGHYDCVNSHNRNASIVGRIAAWLECVPLNLYTAHGFYFHDDQSHASRKATIWLETLLAHITDYTLSQSREDTSFAITSGMIASDRIEYIGNGIDTNRFSPRRPRASVEKSLGLEHGSFRISATGRLVKGKGFGDLLEAFSCFHLEVPASELIIIGGNISQDISPFQQGFTARVAALGLQDVVKITGLTDCVEDYLAVSDLFVLPSYREGLPRALLEAMSMGICSLATDIRGCREVIRDGENGLLFRPRDTNQLAILLKKLSGNPELRLSMAGKAQALARSSFDETQYVGVQVSAINRLLHIGGCSPG